MSETDLHKQKRKKNFAVLGLIIAFIAIIWFVRPLLAIADSKYSSFRHDNVGDKLDISLKACKIHPQVTLDVD